MCKDQENGKMNMVKPFDYSNKFTFESWGEATKPKVALNVLKYKYSTMCLKSKTNAVGWVRLQWKPCTFFKLLNLINVQSNYIFSIIFPLLCFFSLAFYSNQIKSSLTLTEHTSLSLSLLYFRLKGTSFDKFF